MKEFKIGHGLLLVLIKAAYFRLKMISFEFLAFFTHVWSGQRTETM